MSEYLHAKFADIYTYYPCIQWIYGTYDVK